MFVYVARAVINLLIKLFLAIAIRVNELFLIWMLITAIH